MLSNEKELFLPDLASYLEWHYEELYNLNNEIQEKINRKKIVEKEIKEFEEVLDKHFNQ